MDNVEKVIELNDLDSAPGEILLLQTVSYLESLLGGSGSVTRNDGYCAELVLRLRLETVLRATLEVESDYIQVEAYKGEEEDADSSWTGRVESWEELMELLESFEE